MLSLCVKGLEVGVGVDVGVCVEVDGWMRLHGRC